ncbi:hypothetical protein PISL3812_03533 [Talaromyces islandicus]|uniref:Zn(2)-C6 fungal-type domain-containing protein n=1 Tax=Talaromyces islandicus TaxID=28573 RepID=A0A0U1LT00_TALIS|nr:hypothetical protein PISL3812_03533 [Talaromyces islandicus]
MVSSASVPTQYTLTWDARTSSDTSGSSPAASPRRHEFGQPSQRRLREACDGCRHSRVRCGGGHPCSRCRTRAMDCHYGFSRRSGRLRASPLREMQPPAPVTTTPSSTSSSMTTHMREDTNTIATANANPNSNTNSNNTSNHSRGSSTMLDPAAVLNPSSQPPVGDFNNDSWLNFSTFVGASSSMDDMSLYPNFVLDVPAAQAFSAPNTNLNQNNHTFSPPHTPPFSNAPPSNCTCLASQLSCITAMVNYRDLNNIGIDTILNNARETIKALNGQLKCAECTKGTWSFILTIVILQRLLYLFCSLASCRFVDIKTAKIGIGNYQLSEEEDLAHKRMLALSSLKGFEDFVCQFGDAVKKFIRLTETMRSQCKTPLKTDCMNLKWAAEGLEYITARLEQIRVTIESDQWRKEQECCN